MTSDPVARYLAMRAAKVEQRARLRPMTSGEMLDASLGVARQLGSKLLSVSLIPTFFCVAALIFIFGNALPALAFTKSPDDIVNQIGETVSIVALAVFVGGPIFLLGSTYVGSVVIQLTSDYILGKPAEIEIAETKIRGRLGSLFLCGLRELFICFGLILASGAILVASGLLTIVTGQNDATAGVLAVIGGFAMFGGFIVLLGLFARRAIIFPIVVIEGVGIREAGARMKKLMQQSRYQTSGAGVVGSMYVVSLVAFGAIYLGVESVLGIFDIESLVRSWANHSTLEPLFSTAIKLIPEFCTMWALLPFWAIVMTVLYYERRIRIEGFDIEQLAEEIGRDGRTNRFNV